MRVDSETSPAQGGVMPWNQTAAHVRRPRKPPLLSSKILCVDDDSDLLALMEFAFAREGFTVTIAGSSGAARVAVKHDPPDLILLDCYLPEPEGLELCAHFRSVWNIPVILMTDRPSEADEVAAFESGADDYVTKPFAMRVLVQRVRAVLRSAEGSDMGRAQDRLMHRIGTAVFNTSFNELVGIGTSVRLTPSEGKILQLLLTHSGQVIPAQRIMDRIARYDSESSINVVKTHIRNLRLKIAKVIGDIKAITTVPGSGYMLSVETHQPAEAEDVPPLEPKDRA